MEDHSRIVNNFFGEPDAIRKLIMECPMKDHTGSDQVTYPGIVQLPTELHDHIAKRLDAIFKMDTKIKLCFARHSFETMKPPNWAHSDYNMTEYVCLIYLSPHDYPWDGTHFVRHKKTKLEIHPKNQDELDLLLADSNNKQQWDVVYTCPSLYNRAFIFNAKYIHAAAYQWGTSRVNSRLVLTAFFELFC